MPRRILIISYYYPPENSISSRRPLAFAKAFQNDGYDVTVLTRHWDMDNFKTYSDFETSSDKEVTITEEQGIKTIRIGFRHFSNADYLQKFGMSYIDVIFLLRKLLIKGVNVELNVFANFYSFLKEHLKENKYDVVLVSIFPLNLLRVISRFKKLIHVTVVDVRDYYSNHILQKNYQPKLQQKIQNYLFENNLKQWFQGISLVVAVNDSILDRIRVYNKSKHLKVLNGFESNILEGLQKSGNDLFTISILGGVFFQQDLNMMILGFKKFIEGKDDVKICFVGAKMYPDVGNYIETSLPYPQVEVTNRMPREKALNYGFNSHVLFYLGWKGYEGMYSGKIFEYLGLRKNILICPGDDDVIDELLHITKAGMAVNSADEMVDVLNGWYSEWKQTGNLKYNGIESEIIKYTRENQSEKLVRELDRSIK